MTGKIPGDAFEVYVAMGDGRSHAKLAAKYGCCKQAVTKRAIRDNWRERLQEIEVKAREHAAQKAIESLAEINARHLKLWKLVESRAMQALGVHTIDSAMEAAKALDLATKNIRLIKGEPTDRTENVEQIVRREAERLLTIETTEDWSEFENADELPAATESNLLEERHDDDSEAAAPTE